MVSLLAAAVVLLAPALTHDRWRASASEGTPGKKRNSIGAEYWENKGWKLLSYHHSRKKGISVARWLAPASIADKVQPDTVSLVVEVSIVPPSRMPGGGDAHGARVVWRGYALPGGRGEQQFYTWEPFFRPLNSRPPRRARARLRYMFEKLVERDQFLLRDKGARAVVKRVSAQ
jgi:hypothetical protein